MERPFYVIFTGVDLAKKYSDRLIGLVDGKILFNEKANNINKINLEKYTINMNKKILELKVNNENKNLENHLKPQWSWKTLVTVVLFCSVLVFIIKDLEINVTKINLRLFQTILEIFYLGCFHLILVI